jgi:uncharacterized protein YegL
VSKEFIFDVIDNKFPKPRGQTQTGKALEKALKTIKDESRPNACDVVVIITDGGSDNKRETTAAANALHELSVKICAVAVGDINDVRQRELDRLAGDEGDIILCDVFDKLQEKVDATMDCIYKDTICSNTVGDNY